MEDTAESRLQDTLFIVEANSFETHCLWLHFAHNSPSRCYGKSVH